MQNAQRDEEEADDPTTVHRRDAAGKLRPRLRRRGKQVAGHNAA
jgi:hypothetical protein